VKFTSSTGHDLALMQLVSCFATTSAFSMVCSRADNLESVGADHLFETSQCFRIVLWKNLDIHAVLQHFSACPHGQRQTRALTIT
jgi:hypothetical protein